MAARTPRPPPSPLEAHLGFWLRFVSNHVSMRFRQLLDQEGISVAEWVALRTLLERPDASHAELIAALGVTKGAASKLISRLEDKGLAQRQHAGAGTREQTLRLTARGRASMPRLAALADDNDRHFFGHLGTQEREALMQTLQRLVRHHELKTPPVE
jgi:DNA-binding MarR family transcriptional regulator